MLSKTFLGQFLAELFGDFRKNAYFCSSINNLKPVIAYRNSFTQYQLNKVYEYIEEYVRRRVGTRLHRW